MKLNIEEQIPIKTKLYRNNMIQIPISIRSQMNWNEGDRLEMFATTKGIFFKKEGLTNEKRI